MRTNLIQSYLQNNTQAVQQYRADNVKKNFDVNKELSNRTFIKPLPSNGHLVRNSLFDLPSEIFRDIKYDAKAFHHSVKGKANDNELGRLNDLGIHYHKTKVKIILLHIYSLKNSLRYQKQWNLSDWYHSLLLWIFGRNLRFSFLHI